MDKNVIETLIVLASNEREETIRQVESMKSARVKALKDWPESKLYKDLIPEYEENILHFQKCIDQLNKLKEFEFPTDEDVEDLVLGGNMDKNQKYGLFMKGYRDGLYDMLKLIKSKLS